MTRKLKTILLALILVSPILMGAVNNAQLVDGVEVDLGTLTSNHVLGYDASTGRLTLRADNDSGSSGVQSVAVGAGLILGGSATNPEIYPDSVNASVTWDNVQSKPSGLLTGFEFTQEFQNLGSATTPLLALSTGNITDTGGDVTGALNALQVTDLTISGETAEDLLHFSGGSWIRHPIGSNGQILGISGGVLTWVADATGSGYTGDLDDSTQGFADSGSTTRTSYQILDDDGLTISLADESKSVTERVTPEGLFEWLVTGVTYFTLPANVDLSIPSGTVSISAGTLANGENALTITGTFPTDNAAQEGLKYDFTSAGSGASANQRGLFLDLAAGYTGSAGTSALLAQNAVVGTGTDAYSAVANIGIDGRAHGSGAGDTVGVYGKASNSTGQNFGGLFRAETNSSGDNIALFVNARNSGGAGQQVALWAATYNAADPNVTFDSVIVADNGTDAIDIMRLLDNGIQIFRVKDGGNIDMAGNLDATGTVTGDALYQTTAHNYTYALKFTGDSIGDVPVYDGAGWTVADASGASDGDVLTIQADGSAAYEAASGGGKVVQVSTTSNTTTSYTISTAIPDDDTIPQDTEGVSVSSIAFTPTNKNSTLMIDVQVQWAIPSGANNAGTVALFEVGTTNALAAAMLATLPGATDQPGRGTVSRFIFEVPAHSTALRNYAVRVGRDDASTIYVNLDAGGSALYGDIGPLTSMTVWEVSP